MELEAVDIFVEPIIPIALEQLKPSNQSNETNCDDGPNYLSTDNPSKLTRFSNLIQISEHINEPQIIVETTENHHELKYACDECGRRFRLRCTRNAHRLVHSNERPFECWLCHKTYKRRKQLKAHIGSHINLFDCIKCGKRFLRKANRNRHLQKRHGVINREKKSSITTVKQFTCEQCGLSYCQREGLSRHLQTAHSNDWPYKCETCGMGFKAKNGLWDHRKRHTEFQYKCNQCGKTFRKRISLRRHLEDHAGSIVKPFACDYCSKTFRLNFNLVEHRRIHTGEKPFTCEHCPSNFRTISSFYGHLKKEHGISVSARKQEERVRVSTMP